MHKIPDKAMKMASAIQNDTQSVQAEQVQLKARILTYIFLMQNLGEFLKKMKKKLKSHQVHSTCRDMIQLNTC